MDDVSRNVMNYYTTLVKKYGDTAESNSWDKQAQVFRWNKLLEMIFSANSGRGKISLLDFGCGTGDLYTYLVDKMGGDSFCYTGIDIVPEMISIARNKVSKDNGQVFCKDIFVDDIVGSFDFAIMNGIFNHKCSGDQEANDNLKKILVKVFEHCKRGWFLIFVPHMLIGTMRNLITIIHLR